MGLDENELDEYFKKYEHEGDQTGMLDDLEAEQRGKSFLTKF